jgi:hypothetical protein
MPALKTCPNCGNRVNEGVVGCPDCGAKWDEDGAYLGVPENLPSYERDELPKKVGDMTPDQLGLLIFRKAFWGALAAVLAVGLTVWLFGFAVAGCMSGAID